MTKLEEINNEIPVFEDKIKIICSNYGITANELTEELIRFLDLIYTTNEKLSPSHIVDLAWHELILFTRFYDAFCIKHYQRFLHHTPSKKEKPNIFFNTIQLYIKHYGFPNPKIWGKLAQEEWELSDCGSCHN